MSLISVRNLNVSFLNDSHPVPVLNDLSFDIASRGFTCICGKSGCGKSTLLNSLYGIEKSTSGSIKILNTLINQKKSFRENHLNNVSMVFQHYNLFLELSALENVTLPLLIQGIKKEAAITLSSAQAPYLRSFHLKPSSTKRLLPYQEEKSKE